jgi:hypothetical protein
MYKPAVFFISISWILLTGSLAPAQSPETVDEIMAKVAANQDRAESMRTAFVYDQELRLRFLRSNGKVAREETRQYAVTPTEKGTNKQLVRFEGSYEMDGKMIPYSAPGFEYRDMDIDGDLINDLANDLANDRHSRDGIAAELFPLTTREQGKYRFTLKGTREFRGHAAYCIVFEPKSKSWDEDDGTPWAGEILVDRTDYQPVLVSTHLARGIPVAVRTLLGTNLKGLGFQLRFEKFDEGLWFPVSYGSEFEVKALFFYKRKIAISLSNKGFQRAQVAARVTYDPPMKIEKNLKVPEVPPPPSTPPH